MPAIIDLIDADLYTDVGTFLVATLGLASGQCIQGYPNRTPMPPAGPGFVVMTITRKIQLNTTIDEWDETTEDPTTSTQETHWDVVVQLDFYGVQANGWAAIIAGLWRDEVACDALADTCQPLFTDGLLRAPLVNEEEMYEDRWIVTAHLQYNPVVTTAQDFANALEIDLVNVYQAYPP